MLEDLWSILIEYPAEQLFLLRVELCQVSRLGLQLLDLVLQVVVLLRQAAQLVPGDLLVKHRDQ